MSLGAECVTRRIPERGDSRHLIERGMSSVDMAGWRCGILGPASLIEHLRKEHRVKRICLTGGLASGKSTAIAYLKAQGASVIDADKLGHIVYETGTQGYRKVIDAFGEDIVGGDNMIDRGKLGAKVFGNPDELKRLTDIVWPEIRHLAELEMNSYEALYPDGVVVLEAAVLFEAGWEDMGDQVWVIAVEPAVAIERACARDGLDRDAVQSRLDAQLSNDERVAKSDVVIENNGSQAEFFESLQAAWEQLNQ